MPLVKVTAEEAKKLYKAGKGVYLLPVSVYGKKVSPLLYRPYMISLKMGKGHLDEGRLPDAGGPFKLVVRDYKTYLLGDPRAKVSYYESVE